MTSERMRASPDDWAAAIEAYCAGIRTVADILAELGVDRGRFYDKLALEKIPLRGPRQRVPLVLRLPRDRAGDQAASSSGSTRTETAPVSIPVDEPADPTDIPSLAARMAKLVSRNMRLLERSLSGGCADDPERAARTLSLHARMLAGLDKLQTGKDEDAPPDDIDPPPRSLEELRDELRRHLERIREEERSCSLRRDSDAG